MPVSKKKRTISEGVLSKSEPSSPLLPEQQEFHHYLRTRGATQIERVRD